MRALALDPTNPSTLIAGTQDGTGLWQSTNWGGDWSVANSGLVNMTIGALATAPSAPDTVYAASAANGVFHSSDSGVTWRAERRTASASVAPRAAPRSSSAIRRSFAGRRVALDGRRINAWIWIRVGVGDHLGEDQHHEEIAVATRGAFGMSCHGTSMRRFPQPDTLPGRS